MRHTISVLVENKFGVLTRVAGLFSGRGFNIDTLNVAPCHQPGASRMTLVTEGDDATLVQVVRQLNKLPEVLEVQDFREQLYVDRELVLIRQCRCPITIGNHADHDDFSGQDHRCSPRVGDH